MQRTIFGKWVMLDPADQAPEIHYDNRIETERKRSAGADLVNKDHEQVIEIWNNVFIQYNRASHQSLSALPEQHVDTGMGLERLVRVLQDKQSNYDTDIFTPLLQKIESLTGLKYSGTQSKEDIAFRVIADHIRAIAFTIADGQLPSNTGAGYVIRRILRRAIRYAYSFLNVRERILKSALHHFDVEFCRCISRTRHAGKVCHESDLRRRKNHFYRP